MANGDQNTKERPRAIMDYAEEALNQIRRAPRDQQMEIMKDFGEVCFTRGWKAREQRG